MHHMEGRDNREESRRATRSILRIWGSTLYLLDRLEKERAAFRMWADDARNTLRAYVANGAPGGGSRTDLADVIVRIEARAAEYDSMDRKVDEERAKILRIKRTMDEIISDMDLVQRRVLEYRYIDGHGWQFIAMKMNYNERQVRRIEARAVDFISGAVEVEHVE